MSRRSTATPSCDPLTIILGIDPGSRQTGFGVIAVDGQVLADFGARELVVFWEGLGKDT